MDYKCVIIGGGASGLMLAARLDLNETGGRGLILEKTSRPGTKLLMSGGGRCNITHGGSIKGFVDAYGSDAGHTLRRCLYRHSNIELASWLEENGTALADEHGNPVRSDGIAEAGRIFPASMKSSDILALLTGKAALNGWEILTDSGVYDIKRPDGGAGWEVQASPAETFHTDIVVIASGGITYPETGSDGSVFGIIRDLGIAVTPLRSALAPVYVDDYPYEELSGVSLSDVTVTAFSPDHMNTCKGRSARMTGDLLFTHRGFSGPVILNISRYASKGDLIRIKYNRDFGDLPKRMQKILERRSRGPSGDIRTTRLAALLDADDFTVSGIDEHGMVTAGGISLDEIDNSTMKISRLSQGEGQQAIYAVGEALDADGITGGYNLQMCWSTANTAADSIRQTIR